MGYDLQAVVAEEGQLRAAVRDLGSGEVAALGQGLALLVVTEEFADAVTDGGSAEYLGFWRLPGGFDRTLARWSAAGPVAYVEAEYFGGVGEQTAAVWADGALALGPVHLPSGRAFPADGSPISQALRRLGVVAGVGEDEFSAVGLGRHRFGGDWVVTGEDRTGSG
jgi:hypothetical protein